MKAKYTESLIVFISGPSGSGKTTLAENLAKRYNGSEILSLRADNYYLDRSNIPKEERDDINYDTPEAFEIDLMVEHLSTLKQGKSIVMPTYDYTIHNRSHETINVQPAPVILMEGILLLAIEPMRALADVMIFLDTPLDLCLLRRLKRDCIERGRTVASVLEQYEHSVHPMLEQHIMPSKQHATKIFADGGFDPKATTWCCQCIDQHLAKVLIT